MTRHERATLMTGLLFASPWVIGFALFQLGPIVASLYYSFTSFPIVESPQWTGLGNFQTLVQDKQFWTSIYNSVYYTALAVPLGVVMALNIALLGNQNLRGQGIYRTAFFIPSVVSGVVVSVLFANIFAGDFGLLNKALLIIGIHGPQWLGSPVWSKPAFVLMSLWGVGNGMVIYLAGLQSIPVHLYEAAKIDGAVRFQRFRFITLPMLSPTIFFHVIVSIIGSFQVFTTAYVMTNGGPADSTLFYVLFVYRNAFQFFKMGYASALGWILFILILALTVVQFLIGKRWVYYEEEGIQ